jgi:hypothetical protein
MFKAIKAFFANRIERAEGFTLNSRTVYEIETTWLGGIVRIDVIGVERFGELTTLAKHW